MKKYLVKNKTVLTLICLMVLGAFLRYYNLNWGAPYYFHPDERNIASSISQLKFPGQMNPNFFAYGSLPIYTVYFTGVLLNLVRYFQLTFNQPNDNFQIPFDQAIFIGRFFSAFFSILIIALIYKIGKKIHSEKVGLLAAFLASSSVGFIQFSHFGTFEIWITFFCLLLIWTAIKLSHQISIKALILTGLILGILISTKISNILFVILPLFSILISAFNKIPEERYRFVLFKKISFKFLSSFLILGSASLIYLISNPFTFLDFPSFENSINYESKVATGAIDVFYTHEFFDTIPVLYHFKYIYPFLLNPLITVLFIPSFFYIFWISVKSKNKNYLLLISCYLLLFLSQAFLFVKWTRYMVPTLPFIYLIVSILITDLFLNNPKLSSIKYQVLSIVSIISLIFTFSYFVTVLAKPDNRVAAAEWAKQNIPSNSKIISETYDLGIIAFNPNLHNIVLCDFYNSEKSDDLCNNTPLSQTLSNTEYIILPSERLLKMAQLKKTRFPKRYLIYTSFFDITKYKLIFKSPCDFYCKIIYINNPMLSFEQTVNVFDNPTVYIFKKIK